MLGPKPIIYFDAMDEFKIEEFKRGEEFDVAALIKTVFNEFVAPDYSKAGNDFFYTYIEPAKMLERFSRGDVLLTAKAHNAIIGFIEVRDGNHIALLFVDTAWQRKGIAEKLVAKAIASCREKGEALRGFEVNASPYSEKIYAKMGFKKTADMQNINGLRFVPMAMELCEKSAEPLRP